MGKRSNLRASAGDRSIEFLSRMMRKYNGMYLRRVHEGNSGKNPMP